MALIACVTLQFEDCSLSADWCPLRENTLSVQSIMQCTDLDRQSFKAVHLLWIISLDVAIVVFPVVAPQHNNMIQLYVRNWASWNADESPI